MAKTDTTQRLNLSPFTSGERQYLHYLARLVGEMRRLESDVSVTSSTTFANRADLMVDVLAGKSYSVIARGAFTNSGGTQGGKVCLNLSTSTGATFEGFGTLMNGGTTISAADRIDANAVSLGAAVAEGCFTIEAVITVGASGVLSLQFAQSVSGATASVLKKNTILIVRQLD